MAMLAAPPISNDAGASPCPVAGGGCDAERDGAAALSVCTLRAIMLL
jgi:hypothetical protein